MASIGPEQVIRERLSTLRGPIALQPVPGAAGWRSETSVGGFNAKLGTIQFVKARSITRRQIHAVTFEDGDGRLMRFVCSVRQDSEGQWYFAGGAGGSAQGAPTRDHAWVNLAGGGWPKEFYAGGDIVDGGLGVARVRLRAANGTELEDTVEEGVVLFLTDDEVQLPIVAELFDRNGNLVSLHKAMG